MSVNKTNYADNSQGYGETDGDSNFSHRSFLSGIQVCGRRTSDLIGRGDYRHSRIQQSSKRTRALDSGAGRSVRTDSWSRALPLVLPGLPGPKLVHSWRFKPARPQAKPSFIYP